MEKHKYNQGDLIQYRDSQGDLEIGVITRVFQVYSKSGFGFVEWGHQEPIPQQEIPRHRYAVTWTNHNQWGSVGISETYNEEFFAQDIDTNETITLLARGQ